MLALRACLCAAALVASAVIAAPALAAGSASGGGDARVELTLAPPASRAVVPAAIALALGAVGVGVGTTGAILLRGASSAGTTRLRVAEIAGFAAGGAGIVTGVVLFALRARAAPSSVSGLPFRLRVGVGPGAVSVGGAF
jgi:hypothetical protein